MNSSRPFQRSNPRFERRTGDAELWPRLNRSWGKTEMFLRCIFVLVTSAVLAATPATAQTMTSPTITQTPTPDPARRYPLPTYDENWQFLSDPTRRTDPWDIVKYVQLADGIFASFGGEARESYERFGNQNFGLSVPSPNGYLLQRYLLHADFHLGSRLRLWTELNSSFENGRVGGPEPVTGKTNWICIRGLWSSRSFNDLPSPCACEEAARRSRSGPDACMHYGKVRMFP